MIDPSVLTAYRNAVTSEQYALVYLALASVAYADMSDDDGQVTEKVAAAVEALPQLPTPSGVTAPTYWKWQVDLGPFDSEKNANLFYVASYHIWNDSNGDDNTPVFATVVVRGTDIKSGLDGLVEQMKEDLDDFTLRSWTEILAGNFDTHVKDSSEAGVSHGTAIGLQKLLSLPGDTLNGPDGLVEYLQTNFTGSGAYANVPLVVTGHSLGACQAATLAAYIAAKVSGLDIYLHPFAPPTPGNSQFVSVISSAVQTGYIWWNPLDIVPNAYWNLDDPTPQGNNPYGIVQHWGQYGGASCPVLLAGFIEVNKNKIAAMNFSTIWQSSGNLANNELPGATVTDVDYVAEIEYQHFPPIYSQLIPKDEGSSVLPYNYPFGS